MSAVLGVASIAVMFLLARNLTGTTVGLLATGLLTVSNLSAAYAQEGRFYALTQFLSLVSSLCLYALLERRRRRDAAGYVLSTAALLWTHTYGWFVVTAHVVWLLAALREPGPKNARRRTARLAALSVTLAVLTFLPWVPILRDQIQRVAAGYWISEPGWSALAAAAHAMLVPVRVLRWPLVILAALALVHWLAGRFRTSSPEAARQPARTSLRRCHLWGLAAWMTLPILIPFVWSKCATPVFQVKYAIVAQAPALILLALLLARRPAAGLVPLALLIGFFPPNRDRGLIVEDWPRAADILLEHSAADATVFIYKDYAYFALDYYLQDRRRVRPVYTEGQGPNAFAPHYPAGALTFDEMTRCLADSDEPQIWLVLRWGCPRERQELHERLATLREIRTMWKLRSVDVLELWGRPPTAHR
jgi:hypothetical protein